MTEERQRQRQQRLKTLVDERIAAATINRWTLMVFTGNGKGKTTAAFGTATRAVGHGLHVGVVQFIKGGWPNGEQQLLMPLGVEFQVMATDFTWETQNRITDTEACRSTWQHAERMLADSGLDLVILDELTWMLSLKYLPLSTVTVALRKRPEHQSVIITGPGCHREIIAMADTVSEMRAVKHAFDSGIKAQQGIDW